MLIIKSAHVATSTLAGGFDTVKALVSDPSATRRWRWRRRQRRGQRQPRWRRHQVGHELVGVWWSVDGALPWQWQFDILFNSFLSVLCSVSLSFILSLSLPLWLNATELIRAQIFNGTGIRVGVGDRGEHLN